MQVIQKKAKRNLFIGFSLSLLVLVSSSALSYLSIKELLNSQQWVEHTTQVETGLNELISRMKDAETGQRGYLLTGDEAFLEPYTGAEREVADQLIKVQLLTRDNASQQGDFPGLEKLIAEKFSLIRKSIIDKKRGLPPTAQALSNGKAVMDAIRAQVQTMIERENKLMIARNNTMNKYVTVTPWAVVLVSLISMIITFVFYQKINNAAKQSALLHQQLIEKDHTMRKQIEVIGGVAQKVADGDYKIRVNKTDLE